METQQYNPQYIVTPGRISAVYLPRKAFQPFTLALQRGQEQLCLIREEPPGWRRFWQKLFVAEVGTHVYRTHSQGMLPDTYQVINTAGHVLATDQHAKSLVFGGASYTLKRPILGSNSFQWVRDAQGRDVLEIHYTGSDLDLLEAVQVSQPVELAFVACVMLLALCHV